MRHAGTHTTRRVPAPQVRLLRRQVRHPQSCWRRRRRRQCSHLAAEPSRSRHDGDPEARGGAVPARTAAGGRAAAAGAPAPAGRDLCAGAARARDA
eukprot:6585548-Prymnesium_polylepis.1